MTDDQKRTASILKLEPDLFTNKYKSVLYIGAVPPEINNQYDYLYSGRAYLKEFKQAGYEITIVEIYYPNYKFLVKKHQYLFDYIYNDDIENFNPPNNKKYDVIFWWHGPEHVERKKLPKILKRIEKFGKYIIILGCPWGKYDAGIANNNPYQAHLASIYSETLIPLGYNKFEYCGKINIAGSNLTTIKNLENERKNFIFEFFRDR